MTPAEESIVEHFREWASWHADEKGNIVVRDALALCDAYEALDARCEQMTADSFFMQRKLLSPEEAEAVRRDLQQAAHLHAAGIVDLVALLPEPGEQVSEAMRDHRLVETRHVHGSNPRVHMALCSCFSTFSSTLALDAAVRAWAAHVRESGGEL